MVVRVSAGILFFFLQISVSYSFTIKKGFQDDGSDGFGSGGAQEVIYSKPAAFRGVATPLGSGAASSYPGGADSYQMASNQYNLRPAASQSTDWLMPSVLDESATGGAMSTPGFGQTLDFQSRPEGPSSLYQTGELSHMQNAFEHGNYDTETESQGLPAVPDPPLIPELTAGGFAGQSLSYYPYYYYIPYPYFDWHFLTGQYPPGIVSHFSSDFEQGRDHYHDAHYKKYYHGASTGSDPTGQAKIFPNAKPGQSMWRA